jgi:hypothetical protein
MVGLVIHSFIIEKYILEEILVFKRLAKVVE